MYIAFEQVERALSQLRKYHPFFGITFLVCKRDQLPVGKMIRYPINAREEEFLRQFFKPDLKSRYYFQPFRTSAKEGPWLSPKYPSSGSQKTRTQGDLAQAFLHVRNTDKWGWGMNYVRILRDKLELDKSGRVPMLWMAIWLYRERIWRDDAAVGTIIEAFVKEYHISVQEESELFQRPFSDEVQGPLFVKEPYSDAKLLRIVASAPDAQPEEGGIVKHLELRGIGPSHSFGLSPAERLTIVTGDNGLGKTFLLECAWWSLTGHWADQPALPRLDAGRKEPSITFEIAGTQRKTEKVTLKYDWDAQEWPRPKGRPTLPGVVVYARVDGSFAVWDPLRHSAHTRKIVEPSKAGLFLFSRTQVLRGFEGRIEGLLRDWVTWQRNPEKAVFQTFCTVLNRLSPPEMKPLEPGEPIRLPDEPREIPTIKHPYGITPFTQESAGIKRIATIAYLFVWAWNEHRILASLAKRAPQQKMVILIDELEAHLHPRWQRSVLPALLDVSAMLQLDVEPQMIVATHSPLVLASVETKFSEESDKLFHLKLDSHGEATLTEIPFVRYGRIDAWLTSDVFALRHARSKEGEEAIERAKAVMASKVPSQEEINIAHQTLTGVLSEDDEFWPRWGFFLEQKGNKS